MPLIAATATTLKALAEPTRLRIVARLPSSPVTVSALAPELGGKNTTVALSLKPLREAGLVTSKKRGKFVTYSLNPEALNDGKLRFGCCQFGLVQNAN